ncbi:hypothetical protein tinsulaeT_06380 [Thalassotalea insulae]|uniref:Uncharacterized protein n=1 Tax=Thalassotalea insulae TaxID=2056778 RepID=A0ABQ6GMT4_9GAMM|nr:hypothetical protein [Thalassotalea insulae]GLX77298.1 hypothetical protein tinsulaeT_06380 [Thalassotalea insulae]
MFRVFFVVSLFFSICSLLEQSYDFVENDDLNTVKQLILDTPQELDTDFDLPVAVSYANHSVSLLTCSLGLINKPSFIALSSPYQLINPRAPPNIAVFS